MSQYVTSLSKILERLVWFITVVLFALDDGNLNPVMDATKYLLRKG